MTEDYKEKLIKYMTGNIEPETGANEPQFIDKYVGIDCEFFFPWKNGGAKVVVKKGKREVNII